jgi:hypothetical protein
VTKIYDPASYTGTAYDTTNRLLLWPLRGSDGEGDPKPEGDGTGTDKPEGEGDPKPDDEKKTFTQDEVNAIVAREVSQKTRGRLDPKEAGFKSAAELKDFLTQMKSKAEADKTDAEKEKELAIKDAQDTARKEVLDKANSRLLRAEFTIAASKNGVAYIEDALEIAKSLDIWDPQIDDEKETVSGFDEDFFKELKERKPYLFSDAKPKGAGDIGAGANGDGGAGTKAQQKEAKLRQDYPALNRTMSRAERVGIKQ